jgi:hypothetical protein
MVLSNIDCPRHVRGDRGRKIREFCKIRYLMLNTTFQLYRRVVYIIFVIVCYELKMRRKSKSYTEIMYCEISKAMSSLHCGPDVFCLFEARVLTAGHGTSPTVTALEVYILANSGTLGSNIKTMSSQKTTTTTSLC